MMHVANTVGADEAPTLTIVSGATLLVLLVFTVPLTTLDATARALAAGPGAQAWILSGMPLGAATGLLGSGALGDNHGRRKVFLWGLALLAAASALGALARTDLFLILARVVQGFGGAAILACGLGLIGQAFADDRARTRATAVWAAALGAGVATGPIFAALLAPDRRLARCSCRDGAARGGPRSGGARDPARDGHRPAQSHGLDRDDPARRRACRGHVGTHRDAARLGAPLRSAPHRRRPRPARGLRAPRGAASQPDPRPLSLFRRSDFVGATVAAFASGAGVLALMTLVPTLLTRAMHVGPLIAAIVILAWSATSVVTALAARWLPHGLSPRRLLIGGLAGCAVAQLMLLGPAPDEALLRLLPGLFLAGAANGILNAALGRQAVASVPADRTAMGSGANNTACYLGSAIGITGAAVLIAHGADVGGMTGLLRGWAQAVLETAAFSILGALIVAVARER